MGNQSETKELRIRLIAWNHWAEEQVELGLIDEEKLPKCFDRSKKRLKEIGDHMIGSRCHYCGGEFEKGETTFTDNHIMYFHFSCVALQNRMEKKKEKFENRDDD